MLRGETVYREDMTESRYLEEIELVALGLRCRVVAPLLARRARDRDDLASSARSRARSRREEVELLSLLGRFVATAVQNIRAYEAERTTVEELRRLSALRADFVSLVSHELRSPMATVIGSARTLQQRWRELQPEQRESFLALIADETNRLATLIADVLDTSRIEAGTFSYAFGGRRPRRPRPRGRRGGGARAGRGAARDRDRPGAGHPRRPRAAAAGDREPRRQRRQVLAGGRAVEVKASAVNGRVVVDVRDRGPGIAVEDQSLIFEKFGRARSGKVLPGTGLGLFIARSIAEAHGGTLDVRSTPNEGATFRLELPSA